MNSDTDRTEGLAYWRMASAGSDDLVYNDDIEAILGDEWTPLVELDEYTDARGGVVHLAGASYRADAVGDACQAAREGEPMYIYAVATPIPQDAHAVSIYGEPSGVDDSEAVLLGYLPRQVARLVHHDIEPDDLRVFPLVYFLDGGRGHRWPGIRLVVVRRAEETSWDFHPAAIKDVQRRAMKARRGAQTPFESVLGERPEVIMRRAVDLIGHDMSRVLHDLRELEPGEEWEVPLEIAVGHVEDAAGDFSPRELVAAAAAWSVHPEQMARDLLVMMRICAGFDHDEEARYRELAEHIAERWRACVAHRLLELQR